MSKGIILAGGMGSRLFPVTKSISKQLLPVYNKPMVFYPLTTLMLAGVDEILVICTEQSLADFEMLLGKGDQFGVEISYKVQRRPNGIAESLLLGANFIGDSNVALILGDNFFHGTGLGENLSGLTKKGGATIFSYAVRDPRAYGVVESDSKGRVLSIEEKPTSPKSNRVVTGLYFLDSRAIDFAADLVPSHRGELEIIDVLERYRRLGELEAVALGRGTTWMDMGTFEDLADATEYVRVIEKRQGTKLGDPYGLMRPTQPRFDVDK